jgi:hypothetical protein
MGIGSQRYGWQLCSAGAGLLLGVTCLMPTVGVAAEAWPASVSARYKLKFNGVNVGSLDFNSTTGPHGYTLKTAAQVSVLFGTVQWVGNTTVSGVVAAHQPSPSTYAFDWLKNKKGGAIKLGFVGNKATSVSVEPPNKPSPEVVPITEAHKQGVLDPLSAVMAMTRADGAEPCDRRASVFDGKHRFNIVMSFKRQARIAPRKPGGASSIGYVCRLTYEPIAGHKANADTKTYAANKDVEVVLARMGPGGALIPQSLSIPTGWGTGTMVADHIEVTSTAGVRVSLND